MQQPAINYAMPVRDMLYDALSYTAQLKKRSAEIKADKVPCTHAEFLSGWKKDDKLLPVITIVVYMQSDKWDGPVSLHESGFGMEDIAAKMECSVEEVKKAVYKAALKQSKKI